MEEKLTLGQWLKEHRKQRDLTQEELADLIGCAPETVRKLESGRRRPSKMMAELIANYFGIPREQWPQFVRFARSSSSTPGDTETTPSETRIPTAPTLPGPPAHLSPFIGRHKEVKQLVRLILDDDVRLITVTGPPGIGKSTLCLRAARQVQKEFRDGVYWVPALFITDTSLVMQAISTALKLKVGPGETGFRQIKNYLLDKEILIILDNFEQVVGAGPELARLLSECPAVKLLVSSRIPLNISAEQQFPLQAMSLPDEDIRSLVKQDVSSLTRYEAVELFVRRAQAIDPKFILTATNAQDIVAICRALEGLPLAIELAAAHIRLLPPEVMASRIGNTLDLLTSRAQDVMSGQQTLRVTFAWRYELLSEQEKALLRRMSVFVGKFSLAAAEYVAHADKWEQTSAGSLDENSFAPPDDALQDTPAYKTGWQNTTAQDLALLLDQNLIKKDDTLQEPRFQMLWAVREFAHERLVESGEEAPAHRRHALYYLGLAQGAEAQLGSESYAQWLDLLDREHYNITAALEWACSRRGDAEIALNLVSTLAWYWLFRARLGEAHVWLTKALAQPMSADFGQVRDKALETLTLIDLQMQDNEQASELLDRALSVWQNTDLYGDQTFTQTYIDLANNLQADNTDIDWNEKLPSTEPDTGTKDFTRPNHSPPPDSDVGDSRAFSYTNDGWYGLMRLKRSATWSGSLGIGPKKWQPRSVFDQFRSPPPAPDVNRH